MDDSAGFDGASFDPIPSGPDNLDVFDDFWDKYWAEDPAGSTPVTAGGHYQPDAGQSAGDRCGSTEPQPSLLGESDGVLPATGIRYSIAWKAVLKTTRIGMNTEEDVSIAPGTYWDTTLRQKVENLLAEKYPLQDRPVPEDTIVSVSVNKRLEDQRTLSRTPGLAAVASRPQRANNVESKLSSETPRYMPPVSQPTGGPSTASFVVLAARV
ncbi:hypothetical protein LTS09_016108 [Friedmanniomyces endolithicus]|nr:hypothetical protein LTS09_016108 [Friedmanniomyces endolithicus]